MVELEFKQDAIDELATLSADINASVENYRRRRFANGMEKLLEETAAPLTTARAQGREATRLS